MIPIVALVAPERAFAAVSASPPPLAHTLLHVAWMGLIPPVCAFVGGTNFGWHLGVGAPVMVSSDILFVVSVLYYVLLLGGFVATAMLMRWMAPTYRARKDFTAHAALLAACGAPLMLGGFAHLYPQLGFNLILLAPAMIWSVSLLYYGLPPALQTDVDSGMLMATAMLGVFFVAANMLMILSVMLWTLGVGPDIGFNWRQSVSG